MLVRVLQPALQSDGTAQEVLQLFDANVNHEYSVQIWKELGAEWKEGDSKGNAANLYRILREEPGAMSGKIAEVMNNYLNRAWSSDDKTQGGVPAFVSSLVTDNVIFRNNRLRQPDAGFLPAIRDALSQYGDRSRIASFFDSWSQAPDWLTMNSTPEQLFGIQYNANADAVTAGFIDQSSDDMLATVIAGVPSMTTGQYTRLAAAKLGIDPMVLSPQLTAAKDTIKLAEHHIYGSSRLGIQNYDTSTLMNTYDQSAGTNTGFAMSTPAVWYSYLYGDVINRSYKEPWGHGDNGRWSVSRTLGKRYYELTDHLGNVLATVMDRKTGHVNSSIPTLYDYYNPDVVSATDYYPGGMPMSGRSVNWEKTPNGYNGKRNTNEIYGAGNFQDYGMRGHDPRLLRLGWSVDPLAYRYPMLTPYQYASDNPILHIDLDGGEGRPATLQQSGTFSTAQDGTWVNRVNVEVVDKQMQAARFKIRPPDEIGIDYTHTIWGSQAGFEYAKASVKQTAAIIPGATLALKKYANEPITKTDVVIEAIGFIPIGKFAGVAGRFVKAAFEVSADVEHLVAGSYRAINESGAVGREIITATKSGSRVDALKVTNSIIGDLGRDAKPLMGKATNAYPDADKIVVGMQSADGTRGWRIDFDPEKGAHYNWFNNATKEKGAVLFDGTEKQVGDFKQQMTNAR